MENKSEVIVDGTTSQIAGGCGYAVQHDGCKTLNCTKGRQPKLDTVVVCGCGKKVKITFNNSLWD